MSEREEGRPVNNTIKVDGDETHLHCWHVRASAVDTPAITGWEEQICCHCGKVRKQRWHLEDDNRHGPHFVVHYQRYTRVDD